MKKYNGLKRWLVSSAVVLATLGVAQEARADVPQVVTHQGRLFDMVGDPVTGQQDITFVIYDAEVDGLELWVQRVQRVQWVQRVRWGRRGRRDRRGRPACRRVRWSGSPTRPRA